MGLMARAAMTGTNRSVNTMDDSDRAGITHICMSLYYIFSL